MTNLPSETNIYLNTQAKQDDVFDKATPQEKYIILMNDSLQYKNRELESNINDLEAQIEVFEDDNNRMEKGRNYMKGLLKNFVEIHKCYATVTEKKENIICTITQEITKFKRNAKQHLRYLQTVMILFLAVWYEYHRTLTSAGSFNVHRKIIKYV